MTAVVLTLAAGLVASSATAIAMAIRKGGLEMELERAKADVIRTNGELEDVAEELELFRAKSIRQLEGLRDEITDLEDNLDACSDPDVLRGHLDRVLQAATGDHGDTSSG